MTLPIFPALPGLTWPVGKAPSFKSRIRSGESGRERVLSDRADPIWHFTLSFDFLRDEPLLGFNELRTLVGFHASRRGRFAPFLYLDPDDNTASGSIIGTADGVTAQFQLLATVGAQLPSGGTPTPIFAPNQISQIYFNGAPVGLGAVAVNYDTGIITFYSAPPAGTVISVDFTYWFRCRFEDDAVDFEEFLQNIWRQKKLKFCSVPFGVTTAIASGGATGNTGTGATGGGGGPCVTSAGASLGGTWDPNSWVPSGGTTMQLLAGNTEFQLTGGGLFENGFIFSTTSHDSGAYYFEVENVSAGNGARIEVPIHFDKKLIWARCPAGATAGQGFVMGVSNKINPGTRYQLGGDCNAIGMGLFLFSYITGMYMCGVPISTAGYGDGVVRLWNNDPTADPATCTGGISINGLNPGNYFIAIEVENIDPGLGQIYRIHTSANGFLGTVPAGWLGW